MSSAAVELARTLIDTIGEPLGDGRRIRIDASHRRIAAVTHRSPGTVGTYLRRLDELGVRISTEPLVFDLDQLEALEAYPLPPPPRPKLRLVPDLDDAEHEPAATRQPVSLGGANVELAIDAITTIAHLAAIHPDSAPTLDHLAEFITQLALATVDESRDPARSEVARSREPESRDRATRNRAPQPLPNEVREEGSSYSTPTSLTSSDIDRARDESREQSFARSRDGRKSRERVARTPDRVLGLVGSLEQAAAVHGLGGITNLEGLAQALEPFDDEQVAYAVARLVVEVDNQTWLPRESWVNNPVAKLVSRAKEADPLYFPAIIPTTPTPTPTTTDTGADAGAPVVVPVEAEPEPEPSPEHVEALAVVASLDAGARAELDGRLVAGELAGFSGGTVRRMIANDHPALNTLRARLLARDRHPL